MSEHARLMPSNPRWVHCPGSVREEDNYPDESSEAALDGTFTHLLLKSSLSYKRCPTTMVGLSICNSNGIEPIIDADRAERVRHAYSYVLERKAELKKIYPNHEVKVESESISDPGEKFERDDWWGTCDITISIFTPEDHVIYIEVIDYKDGFSRVDVNDNSQLISYLGGKVGDRSVFLKDCKLKMTIIQPRTSPIIRHSSMTPLELSEALIDMNEAAKKTDDPKAPLIPDNEAGKGYCKWCKHKTNCAALKRLRTEKMADVLGPTHDLVSWTSRAEIISTVGSEALGAFLDIEHVFKSLFEDSKKEMEKRLGDGEIIPGFEMLPGRSTKKWNIPEEKIFRLLKDYGFEDSDIYPNKLISPAQLLKHEKLTSEEKIGIEVKFMKKIQGGLKLKSVNVKDVNSMFGDIKGDKNGN